MRCNKMFACPPLDADRLVHRDADAAIEAYLDGVDIFPDTVQVQAYVPKEIEEEHLEWAANDALDVLLEKLDEDFGDPDEATEWTEKWRSEALVFARAVVSTYQVGAYVTCGEPVTVDVPAWIAAHRPDWTRSLPRLPRPKNDGDIDDLCGLCGQLGADKMAMWTGGGIYWPGEIRPDTEFVHAECEEEETRRAHAALSQKQRDAVIRAASGGIWP